jgi:hypothetical protein
VGKSGPTGSFRCHVAQSNATHKREEEEGIHPVDLTASRQAASKRKATAKNAQAEIYLHRHRTAPPRSGLLPRPSSVRLSSPAAPRDRVERPDLSLAACGSGAASSAASIWG